ncbi:MAG: peptidylprolyl isomerase [Nostochopsis sp.]
MSNTLTANNPNLLPISSEEIIQHIKLSCEMPSILEAIATQKIISKAAEKVGIKVEIEEMQQAADSLRFVNHLHKASDTWEWLEKHYLSLDDFEELAHNKILSAKLVNHLFAEQVESFFYAHQIDYVAAATYEVILDDEDLALELFFTLQEAEITFPEIARQYIQDPELRRAGGYQGTRYRVNLQPEIAAAVFAATPPQAIKPITTSKGVYLIWVEEIIQPQLDEQLRTKILENLFRNWLKQEIEKLEIVI